MGLKDINFTGKCSVLDELARLFLLSLSSLSCFDTTCYYYYISYGRHHLISFCFILDTLLNYVISSDYICWGDVENMAISIYTAVGSINVSPTTFISVFLLALLRMGPTRPPPGIFSWGAGRRLWQRSHLHPGAVSGYNKSFRHVRPAEEWCSHIGLGHRTVCHVRHCNFSLGRISDRASNYSSSSPLGRFPAPACRRALRLAQRWWPAYDSDAGKAPFDVALKIWLWVG